MRGRTGAGWGKPPAPALTRASALVQGLADPLRPIHANSLVQCGIVGLLNFSPIVLSVPEEVMVNNVNLAIELENLSYFIQD